VRACKAIPTEEVQRLSEFDADGRSLKAEWQTLIDDATKRLGTVQRTLTLTFSPDPNPDPNLNFHLSLNPNPNPNPIPTPTPTRHRRGPSVPCHGHRSLRRARARLSCGG
jgi:hypothetical protein